MTRETWNKLHHRMVMALRRIDSKFERTMLKLRWLNWAERKTGKTCFFVQWE